MIPLKTATVQDDYAWIWEGDDALDRTGDEWRAEYEAALESGDMARMPLRPGAKPTVFWLRHPTRALHRIWEDLYAGGLSTAARKIAAHAIVKADNPGFPGEWVGRDSNGYPCVPEETMEILDHAKYGDEWLVTAVAAAVLKEIRKN